MWTHLFVRLAAWMSEPEGCWRHLAVLHFMSVGDHYKWLIFNFHFVFRAATAQIGPRMPHRLFSRSHAIRHMHAHLVRTLWYSDKPVAGAATYTKHSKHKWRTPMPSAGFEPRNPSNQEASGIRVLDRAATIIGSLISYSLQFVEWQEQWGWGEQISAYTKMHQTW